MDDHSSDEAALRSALEAYRREPLSAQCRQDVFDRITDLTDSMRRTSLSIEEVLGLLRQILRDVPHSRLDEDQAMQHAIVQYFR